MRRKLPFLIRVSPSAVGIALFAELLLLVCFSVETGSSLLTLKIRSPR